MANLLAFGFSSAGAKPRATVVGNVNRPRANKRDYDATYDAMKRKRAFIPAWLDLFPWLVREKGADGDTDDAESEVIYCCICRKHPSYADKKSPLFIGSQNFRIDPLKTHDRSQQHASCSRLEKRANDTTPLHKTPLGHGLLRMTQMQRDKYRMLFNTSYAVARRCKPFIDYEYICRLQVKNGLKLGENLLNEKAAAEFTRYIAMHLRNETKGDLKAANYLAVLADGSTDAAVIEQEVIMVRYVTRNGQPHTKLAGLVGAEHGHADGVYSAIKTGLGQVRPDNDMPELICGNFDGASVMMGNVGGVKAKLQADHPWALVIHCVAHKLELGILDAVKSVPYLGEFENSVKDVIKLYHYSPKRRRELAQVAENLNAEFRSFSDIHQVRWVASKERALKTLLQNFDALASHMEHMAASTKNSLDERSRARGLLDIFLSVRFLSWLHLMLDFTRCVTSVSKKFQEENLLLIQVGGIIEDLKGALSDLNETPGEYVASFQDNYDAQEKTFKGRAVRAQRTTRAATAVVNDPTTIEDNARTLTMATIGYLEKRFQNFNEAPLSLFQVFDFKTWPYDMEELRTYGDEQVMNLAEHFETPLERRDCDVSKIKTQWRGLKRQVVKLRTSPVFPVYSDLLKSKEPGSDFEDVLHLVEIMFTMSPSTAECERQFSGMNLIKTNRRCRLRQDTLDNLMKIHCDGPDDVDFLPDPAIDLYITETKGYRHLSGHQLPSVPRDRSKAGSGNPDEVIDLIDVSDDEGPEDNGDASGVNDLTSDVEEEPPTDSH